MNPSRRWLWLLLLVPIGLGLSRLRFDVEILNLLPQKSAVVQGLKLYQENFANARELVVTLHSPSAELSENATRSLALAWRGRPDLARRVTWQPPWMESPSEAAEFLAYLWLNQPVADFSNAVHRLREPALSEALGEARTQLATSFSPREIALLGYDPLRLTELPEGVSGQSFGTGEQLFASSNGTFHVMFVEAAPDLSSYKSCLAWLESMQDVERDLRRDGILPADVSVNYTGRPAFVSEIAGGMERDMSASIAGTMIIIASLFWLFHRRWKPLLWLLTLLILILTGTMAIGALVFGTMSVISLGFAAILLGLAVDYGLILYQESQAMPRASVEKIRRLIGPSILWSALTSAAAFALLNLSSLPGLSQLGTLVAIGVLLGSAIMILAYLPPLMNPRDRSSPSTLEESSPEPVKKPRAILAWTVTGLLVVGSVWTWWGHPPRFDHTANALRPSQSDAYATVEAIKRELGRPQEPMWVLISGGDSTGVRNNLVRAEEILTRARNEGSIDQFTLPTQLWPDEERQGSNATMFASMHVDEDQIRRSFAANGFTSMAAGLTERFVATWQRATRSDGVFWPTNGASQWILGQTTARTQEAWIALGFIYRSDGDAAAESSLARLRQQLAEIGANLSGWDLLGPSMFQTVKGELSRVLWPMGVMLVLCLGLAFRGVAGILLSAATIGVSACGLFLVMQVAGWSWNLMNLMALPLLLGASVDYSIHIQLALRRHNGQSSWVRKTTGRALLLCAATTTTGFASLGLSSNAGLASLGQVCAVGLISSFITAAYLLPVWWKLVNRR